MTPKIEELDFDGIVRAPKRRGRRQSSRNQATQRGYRGTHSTPKVAAQPLTLAEELADSSDAAEPVMRSRSGRASEDGAVRRRRSPWPRILLTLFLLAASIAAGFGGWWMWHNRLRQVNIQVNGTTVTTKVYTPVNELLAANNSFDINPGKLLSVSGKTLNATGGQPIQVSVNGTKVPANAQSDVHIAEGDNISVKSGNDVTEPHEVKTKTVPYNTVMETGGAIQYVKQQGQEGKHEWWTGKQSKETVDKGVTTQPKDLVIGSKDAQPKDGLYIAITFDDGPSQYTDKILKILKEKNAKATFFNLSENAQAFTDAEKAVLADGHALGSHSTSHEYLPKLTRDQLRKDLNGSFETIKGISGNESRLFRSPYGAFDKQNWINVSDVISANVLWNIDTLDWKRPGPDKIRDAVLHNAYNGAIVLMHDGGGDREQDVAALPGIIDGLQKQGYKLVTVPELMKLDGTFPEHVTKGKPASANAGADKDTSTNASTTAEATANSTTQQ